jgi:hypothetical protein
MPRASLSASLLSTHTSGVQKNYLHTSIGRRYAFISTPKFKSLTDPSIPINKQLFLLTVDGNIFSNARGVFVGTLSDQPCYWDGANLAHLLPCSGYVSGSATSYNTIIVGFVNSTTSENTEVPCYWDSSDVLHLLDKVTPEVNYLYGKVFGMYDSIMVGYVNDSTNQNDTVPCYWDSSKDLHILPTGGYVGGQAYCIMDSYIVGYMLNENDDKQPCYWNYVVEDEIDPILLNIQDFSSGEATYTHEGIIVGYVSNAPDVNQPCYWNIIGNTLNLLPFAPYVSGVAMSIDNNVKVGFVVDEDGNRTPCYWDTRDGLRVLQTCGFGIANCVYNNVAVGYIINPRNEQQACYWEL